VTNANSYKLTGSCGFGDNCKYLHSREVYKAGWALDRDWEIQTKGKKQKGTVVASRRGKTDADDGGVTEEEAKMLEKIPFACTICKRPYTKPIVTTCGHYFCEACALQRFRKTPNCETCGAGTGGVFNAAKNLQKLLDRKRIREEKLQEKELEGLDSDDDE
jgi:RING finger protein 113A